MKKTAQLRLELLPTYGWGGERANAGRKPAAKQAGTPHRSREELGGCVPVHVTLRARAGIPSLRTHRMYAAVARALRGIGARDEALLVHFCVQTNHLHLILETQGAATLGRAMRALSIRLSLGTNRLLGTRGRALVDRYHAHALRTPTEVQNAVAYVLGNFASHARRRGEHVPADFVDPYSSAAPIGPDGLPPPVSPPRTWLLASGGVIAREPGAVYAAAA